ncbi:MAG TPA: hypothetical protein ENH89_13410 [Aurantimonas coralicida]|uniref:Uncharacterized protein n=1 Tax=Aurantimonas coralicida TaxID=182270 RepID=A0A9C9NH03_9HYPH|nr:hypothetical protein [Aurantimonas coralicida]
MPTRVEPVQLYSRRHFVFLGLGIAASGALDPWGLFAGNEELRYSYDKKTRSIKVMIGRLERLRGVSQDAVREACRREADLILADAKARSLRLDSYHRWGVRL